MFPEADWGHTFTVKSNRVVGRDLSGSSQPSGLCPQAQQKQGQAFRQPCRWLNSHLCSPSDEVCKVPTGLGKQMLCFGIMAPFSSHLTELQDRKIIRIHFLTELSNTLPMVLVVSF